MTKERNKQEMPQPVEVKGHESPENMVERENEAVLQQTLDAIAEAKHAHLPGSSVEEIKKSAAEFSTEVSSAGKELLADLKNISKEELLDRLSNSLKEEPGFEEVVSSFKERAPLLTVEIEASKDTHRAVSNLKKLLRILEGEIGSEALRKLPLHVSTHGDDVRIMRNGHLRVNVLVKSIKLSAEAIKSSRTVEQIVKGEVRPPETPLQVDTKEALGKGGADIADSIQVDLEDIDPEEVRGEVQQEGISISTEVKTEETPPKVEKKDNLERDFEEEYDALMGTYPNIGGIYDWRMYGKKFEKLDKLKEILEALKDSGLDLDAIDIILPVADGSETRLTSRALYINMADSPEGIVAALDKEVADNESVASSDPSPTKDPVAEKEDAEEEEKEVNPELSEIRLKYLQKLKVLEDNMGKIGKEAGEKPKDLIAEMEASMSGTHILAVEESVVKEFALKKKISEEDSRIIFEGVRSRLEYVDAKKALGQKLFNAKRNQLSLTLSGEELKNALQEYKSGEIFDQLVVKEAAFLQKRKVEEWPPEKRSIFRSLAGSVIEAGAKGLSWYSKQGKVKKFIISSAIVTGIGISSGAVAGIGGAAMLLAGRVPRYAMSILGAGAVKKYVAPKIDAKTEKIFSENLANAKKEFEINDLLKIEDRYLQAVKQYKKDKVIDAAEKMVLMGLAGFGAGVLGRSLENLAEAAAGAPSFPAHPPEQWAKDHESAANITRRMVVDKELSRPATIAEREVTAARPEGGGVAEHPILEKTSANFVEANKGGGDSVWKMTERQLKAHYSDRWAKMNSAQRTYVLDSIKDKMGDAASSKIGDGTKIDFEKFIGKKEEMDKLFEATQKLTESQVKSIEMHDRALDEWVRMHRGEVLTQAKADEIMTRIEHPVPPEDLPVGRSLNELSAKGIEAPAEYYDPEAAASAASSEAPAEYYDPDAAPLKAEAGIPKEYYEAPEGKLKAPYPIYDSGAVKPGGVPGSSIGYEVYDSPMRPEVGGVTKEGFYDSGAIRPRVPEAAPISMNMDHLPRAISNMQRADITTGEFSSVKDISIKEFMEKVPSTHDLEENPLLAEKIENGTLEVKAMGADGIERSFKVTSNHVGARDFMESMRGQLAHRRISYASMGKFTDLLKRGSRTV